MEIMYFWIFYPKCIYLFKIQKVGMDTEPNKICLVCRQKKLSWYLKYKYSCIPNVVNFPRVA
jgi:hypothetical protein